MKQRAARGAVVLAFLAIAWLVAATATTSASTPGICGTLGLKEQRIVGGNNLKANNPGNAGSMDWLRGTGDRASFNVPVGPILRKDCLGEVGGILVKMRFADDAGNLTAADYTVGLWYSNTPNEAGALEWGVSYGSDSSGDFESNGPQHMTSKIIAGQCGLTAGDHVTLRIVADTDGSGNHGWKGQCLGTGGTTWFSMDPITPVHVNIYSTGIALVNRWRLGGVGGLGLDASALKYADFNGSWGGWVHSNCFANGSSGDEYRYNTVSNTEFTITHESANTGC